MNPLWEQQRTLDPTHLSTANTSMGSASRATNKRDSHCEYTRFIVDEPLISFGMKAGTEQLDPLPPNWRSEESAAEDPDGKPLEMEDEDPELVRKRRELKAIEEKIMLKRAAIALKMVNPFAKRMTLPELSSDEQSAKCDGTTLRDRVNAILHQHHPPNYKRSKVQSKSGQRDKMNPSFPRQADHPLKLRVYSLLRRRCPDPHVVPPNSEVLDVLPPLPPSQSFTTPPEEENGVNKGFLRFLEVLNKGVDLNVLSKIVNDDSDVVASPDEMLNNKLSVVESNSDVACTTKSQTTSSGANPLRSNWTSSGERRTVSRERSHNDRRSLPIEEEEEEEKTNDRGGHTLSTRSPSKSPPPKVKKKEEDKKEKAKMDERQEQLQNILKTLGFSLEADEMSRLADRTQERLYGRKPSGNQRPDSQDEDSHRCDGHSSSSFSTCSPSKSVCSSSSPHRDSHKREQTSHKGSDVQDVYEDDEESQSHQTDPSPAQPTASSQDTVLFQLSQYNAYHNGIHGSPADVDSTYAQGESHPSKHSFIGFTYPQNTLQHSPFPVAQPHKPNKQSHNYNTWGRFNPDLSMSEGQTGLIKGPRCLTLVQNSVKVKRTMKNQIERRLLNCESFSPFPSSGL